MIIAEKVKDLVVVGEDTSKKARISQDKLAKLQYLLTKGLYKDPITAVIAEWTNNGIDSVVQAGKDPIENPVLVKIEKSDKGQYIFRVEDRGVGLDDRDFEDICMNYLESTKENDNDTIGHFGIGMKSFLALERSATFTCVKNGIERRYIVYEGAEFVNYDLVYEKPTDAENGVTAEISINGWGERAQFVDKAKMKLAYYDTAVLLIDGAAQKTEIYRNELFQWSTSCNSSAMHLCLKDVYYPIDWEALGIKQINFPVAIRLSLSDGITPTPSRESYITNERTKKILTDKIKEVADWFVSRYNETVKNFKSFMEAYEYLGELRFYVKLEGKDFCINELLGHSKFTIDNVKVDGIVLRNPNEYKVKRYELLRGYSLAGYMDGRGSLKTAKISVSKENHIFGKNKTVLVAENFRGNIKEFLKFKHGNHTLFLRENGYERPLELDTLGPNGQVKLDNESYKAILDLTSKPKKDWKAHIAEWDLVVSSIVSTFIDGRNVDSTQEFADWLEEKKERQRELRRLKDGSDYTGLGKQVGDVTLAYSYERYNKVHFEKKAYPIKDLHKNRYLTVLITEDDKVDLAKGIVSMMSDELKEVVRFALVGKKEIKKVPEHFQFINFQRFMSRDCKPFKRLASAIKFEELLKDYKKIDNINHPIFSKTLKRVNKDAKKLQEYVDKNISQVRDDIKNQIIDAADLNNLYDKELWEEYSRLKEQIRKLDFVSLINVPSSWHHALKKRYNTLINQFLLFRKKFYDDLEGAEIVLKDKNKKDEVV